MYTLIFDDTKVLKKDVVHLQKNTQIARKIESFLKQFKQDPFLSQYNIKILQPKSAKIYRIRIGTWRIIYSIDIGNKIIIIHRIAPRKDIYK